MTASFKTPARIGLIGVSGYGRVHLKLARELRDLGALTIGAATVINPDEEPATVAELESHGTRIYHSFEQMFAAEAETLDACLIPTGIPWHARMCIAAMEAGLDALVEKPLAGSGAEVAAIRTVERNTGRFVAVGFQDIYPDETADLKSALCRGAIGELRAIRLIGIWPRPVSYYRRNQWAGRLKTGRTVVNDSPLNNGLAHFVHLALFLAGPSLHEAAEAELIEAELFRAHDIESFDTGVARARTATGVELWFGVSHASDQPRDVLLRIDGTHGTIEWRHERRELVSEQDGSTKVCPLPPLLETRRTMLKKFLRHRLQPAELIATTAMAERHTRLIEAIHASAAICPLHAGQFEQLQRDTRTFLSIRGLHSTLQRAFDEGSTLRAAGFQG
jgi:predicted dehydrogenase